MVNVIPSIPEPLPTLPPLAAELEAEIYTHKSSTSTTITANYERLEFLGDTALHLAVSRVLYNHDDALVKGVMNDLVKLYFSNENVVRWGKIYGLGEKVIVGQSLLPLSEDSRASYAGALFKAYMGALSLQSQEVVNNFVGELMLPGLEAVRTSLRPPPVDCGALQRLNEMLRGLELGLPEYSVDDTRVPGPTNFYVKCMVQGHVVGRADGRAIKEAKRRAAESALGRGRTWFAVMQPLP
jgi:ribonuclease-3